MQGGGTVFTHPPPNIPPTFACYNKCVSRQSFVFNRLRILPEKNLAPSAQTSAIGEQYICIRDGAGEEEWTSPAPSRVVGHCAADFAAREG